MMAKKPMIKIQIEDIEYVTTVYVYNSEFERMGEPRHRFTVHMKNGDVHDVSYSTRFEATAVREVLAGRTGGIVRLL